MTPWNFTSQAVDDRPFNSTSRYFLPINDGRNITAVELRLTVAVSLEMKFFYEWKFN